jgi:hypothetical protein
MMKTPGFQSRFPVGKKRGKHNRRLKPSFYGFNRMGLEEIPKIGGRRLVSMARVSGFPCERRRKGASVYIAAPD